MRRSLPLAQILLMFLCLVVMPVGSARGELILYDDRDAFLEALAGLQEIHDDFADLQQGYYADPITRSAGTGYEYTLASSSIVGLMVHELLISTVLPKSVIELTAGTIQAIGGEFGLWDFDGQSMAGDLIITLQNGSVITRSIDDSTEFVGVIGVGENVMSLAIGAATNAPLVTVASMIIATPAPGAWPLIILAPLLMGRSRRSRRG